MADRTHDRHGPWIAIAWCIGVTALAVALFSAWHAPGRPETGSARAPIASTPIGTTQ